MSQTNDLGEEGVQGDPVSEEFEFYFPFAKTLALNLTAPEDTSIAAAWVQKLEAEPESEEEKRTRLNYLKLLLFVLQRDRLSGIFRKQPPSGALQPFPQGLSILDMGNLLLDQDDTPTCGEGDARCLPYTIEISNDLREFVASQEIPNFGIQMYYAWSSEEPVHKWVSFDEEKFPQFVLDKIKQLKETKSDEKSTIIKNGCVVPRKGCDLPLLEKCSKKRVKTPQEIERSQGRSFHTYMGLVGRMGNFDKCDDDQDKGQRQEQRKGKCLKRNGQRRLPGSGGEAEDMSPEEDCNNLFTSSGGLNNQNRPGFCTCPSPQHANCPDHFAKGGPQPFESQQMPARNCSHSARPETDNSQWNMAVNRPPSARRYNADQCPESEINQPMQPQRRTPSPRPKSSSPSRTNDCPPQVTGNAGGVCNEVPLCICTSPCTCPCPRASSQGPSSNAPSGGRGAMDPSCAYPKQNGAGFRRSGGEPCAAAFQGPSTCPPGQGRSDQGARPNGRPKNLQVIHCYDAQNPDPSLMQALGESWAEDLNISGFINKKVCPPTEKSAMLSKKANAPPRREPFDVQQQGRVCTPTPTAPPCQQAAGMSRMGQQKPEMYTPPSVGQRLHSPPPARSPHTPALQSGGHPVCGVPQEPQQQYRPSQQAAYASQQCPENYQECEDAMPEQMQPGYGDPCGRPAPEPCKPSSQPSAQPKNMPCYSAGPLPMNNNSERLANMVSVLQGIKQRTEAHREKCDQGGPRKSPINDGTFCQGTCQPPANVCPEQPPPDGAMFSNYCGESRPPRTPVGPDGGAFMRHPATYPKGAGAGKCPGYMPDRGYVNLTNAFQGKNSFLPRPGQRQPAQPCPAQYVNNMADVCDGGEEDEDECESSESGDICPPEPGQNYEMPTCPPQKIPGRTPQQGPCNMGDMQTCGPQNAMSVRPKQNVCAGAWNEVPCSISQKPNLGRSPRVESRPNREPGSQTCGPQKLCPGRTSKQEQPDYRECDGQAAAPKRISPGKTVSQDPRTFTQPDVQSCPPRRPSPGKQTQVEQYPQAWEGVPSSSPGKSPRSKEGMQALSPRKTSPGKAIQEETYDEDFDDMPSSASAMARQGTYQVDSRKGSPRKKSPGKMVQQEAEEWLDMSSHATQLSSTGTSFQSDGRTNKGGDAQVCSPRKPSPGKPPQQQPEDWDDIPTDLTLTTSSGSRTDSKRSDLTPTCFPLEWGVTEGNGVKPYPGQNAPQTCAPQTCAPQTCAPQTCAPQKNNAGMLQVKQEGSKTCTPQNAAPQKPNPRTQPSQSKLPRQKSVPRQNQSITSSKSKPVQKSTRIPSKSEVRNDTRSKTVSKTTTKIKSDTSMKIKSPTEMKIKPKSKATFKSVSKDLMFETKWKTPQQLSLRKPQEQVQCFTPAQMAELQNCVQIMQESIPSYRGNTYVDNSLVYHRTRPPLVKISTPNQYMGSVSQDSFHNISSIHQYDSCEFNNPNAQIQMQFCEEDEDENIEYMPFCSLNADLNVSKFLNLPGVAAENPQCQQAPQQRPRNPEQQGTSCQSFQEEENFDDCDNPRGGFY